MSKTVGKLSLLVLLLYHLQILQLCEGIRPFRKQTEDKTKCPKVKGLRNFDVAQVPFVLCLSFWNREILLFASQLLWKTNFQFFCNILKFSIRIWMHARFAYIFLILTRCYFCITFVLQAENSWKYVYFLK